MPEHKSSMKQANLTLRLDNKQDGGAGQSRGGAGDGGPAPSSLALSLVGPAPSSLAFRLVVATVLGVIVVIVVVAALADKLLVAPVDGVAQHVLARHLQVVQALLRRDAQGVLGAGVVDHAQRGEILLARLRGAVTQAPRLDHGRVGIGAALVVAVGLGAVGRALREGAADLARGALRFEVVEVVLDCLRDVCLRTVVVVGQPLVLRYSRASSMAVWSVQSILNPNSSASQAQVCAIAAGAERAARAA